MNSEQDKLHYVIILLLFQAFLLLYITTGKGLRLFNFTPGLEQIPTYIFFIVIGISILSVIMVRILYKLIKKETKNKIRQVKLEEKERLIERLRSQKHDFSNHLQTIYGMIQLGKEAEVKDYIRSLNQELKTVTKTKGNTEKTILDSILIPMKEEAEAEELNFIYQVDSGIKKINCSLNKLFRIVSNLTENAIEATKKSSGEEKIEIKGINKIDYYVISVYNTGAAIEDEVKDKLFEPGVSTKGEDRGFGLHIIKSLVQETGGELEIKSETGWGTEFICYLPK